MRTQMYFQEEIIVDVLSRLPVMSLFRFKCVSKSWKALICETSFKKKHLNHSKNDKLLIQQSTKDCKCAFYCSSLSTKTTSNQIVKDVHELSRAHGIYKIFCYCDGLFLIGMVVAVGDKTDFLLWNPSTRESVLLPSHLNTFFNYDFLMFGLGYDPTSDDYKVVKVSDDDEVPVEILSLKTGSRREIDAGYYFAQGDGWEYLAFVQGTFHWLVFSGYPVLSMISFNISNEVFGELPLPEEMRLVHVHEVIELGVTVLDGMLCVNYTVMKENSIVFDLWVMKDYGVKESWTKLFTVRDAKMPQHIMPIIPKYIFADGEVLLSTDGGTVLRTYKESNGRSNVIGPLITHEDTSSWDEWGYTESLISPKDYVLLA